MLMVESSYLFESNHKLIYIFKVNIKFQRRNRNHREEANALKLRTCSGNEARGGTNQQLMSKKLKSGEFKNKGGQPCR